MDQSFQSRAPGHDNGQADNPESTIQSKPSEQIDYGQKLLAYLRGLPDSERPTIGIPDGTPNLLTSKQMANRLEQDPEWLAWMAKAYRQVLEDDLAATAHSQIEAPRRTSTPGQVGWFLDDPYVRDLIKGGVKIRVKTSHSEHNRRHHGTEQVDTSRVILSIAGSGILPGRRLAELTSTLIDAPGLEETIEALTLTVFGENKRFWLHRERLFDGPVESRAEAVRKLEQLVKNQLGDCCQRKP